MKVVLTTAPRVESTIGRTVESLVSNGWRPTVFAEPGSDLSGCESLDVVRNTRRRGMWFNWVHACESVLDSDLVLTVQDDVEFVDGAREWLESHPVPGEWGMASLYTSRMYMMGQRDAGWFTFNERPFWGACAMLFRGDVLRRVLKLSRQWRGMKRGLADEDVDGIDTAVHRALEVMGLPLWFTNPSLCQHIGRVSSVEGHGGNTGNRSARYVGVPA